MESIRLLKDEEIKEYVDISADAYPGLGFSLPEEKQKMAERLIKNLKEDSRINIYGCFRDNKLLGGMKLHDFKMRLGSRKIGAGGVGMVAVHLMHKKEKVAKGMITFFLRHYRDRGFPIAMLYPFRPDFYKSMGFGFGTKMNQYSIKPKDLPRGGIKSGVRFASEEDGRLLLDCYARVAERTNGMLDRTEADFKYTFSIPQNRVAAYSKNGRIEGYMVFIFRRASLENNLKNDIFIKEFLYESTEALRSLLAFLNTQEDQINRVILNTFDENFHHILMDPRNGTDNILTSVYHESNLQGVGIMYRVTDTEMLFDALKEHNFNNQSCKLRLNINDNFIEENNRSLTIHFTEGKALKAENGEYEVSVDMDIADFSSLIVGAVDFRTLLKYGMARISDQGYADTVGRIFAMPEKPVCVTLF